jgi:hypothetical protein
MFVEEMLTVDHSLILIPFVGMLLLTLVVHVYLFYRRITAIRRTGIQLRTRADLDKLGPLAVNASNNFQNLCELPVIFYACVLALYVTNQVDAGYLVCAFGFLIFRVIHSAIHCTYNNIMQRFSVYAISSLFLWVMVVRLALGMLHNLIF